MKSQSEERKEGHTRVQWVATVLVSTTMLTYGLQFGWISPMSKVLQSEKSPVGRLLSDTEISLVAGASNLSATVSTVFLVYVVDTFGRKCGIMFISCAQLISWIITLCPASVGSLVAARLCCGLGAAGCFHVVPMYVKELAQDDIRGALGAGAMLAQYPGVLAMYALGAALPYRTAVYAVVALPAITLVTLWKLPESPAFLVKTGKMEEAAATVAYLRGLTIHHKSVQTQIDLIKKEDDNFKSIPNISLFTIFGKRAWRRGFLVLLALILVRGLNGSLTVISFASTLLAESGAGVRADLQALALPIFLTLGSVITMTSVDRLGRKTLLLVTLGLSGVTLAGLAGWSLARAQGAAPPSWVLIVALVITVCCFGAGVSPIPFIIMPEIFNFQIRAKLMACLCMVAWFISFVQLIAFTAISGHFGDYAAFFVFAVINFLGVIVALLFLPETGSKSIEQIEAELRKEKKVVAS